MCNSITSKQTGDMKTRDIIVVAKNSLCTSARWEATYAPLRLASESARVVVNCLSDSTKLFFNGKIPTNAQGDCVSQSRSLQPYRGARRNCQCNRILVWEGQQLDIGIDWEVQRSYDLRKHEDDGIAASLNCNTNWSHSCSTYQLQDPCLVSIVISKHYVKSSGYADMKLFRMENKMIGLNEELRGKLLLRPLGRRSGT